MELRQLSYFCRTCELGSYTAAAAELYVTEQTISASIKKLESELRCKLLKRTQTGMIPTYEGAIFLEKAQQVLALIEEAQKAVRSKKRGERITIRFHIGLLTVPESENFSLSVLDTFMAEYPLVDIEVTEHSAQKCIKHVMEDEADLALVYERPDDPALDVVELFQGEMVLAVSRNNPLVALDQVTWADLEGQTFLTAGQGGAGLAAMRDVFEQMGCAPLLRSVTSMHYIDAVGADQGVALALKGHPKFVDREGIVMKRFAADCRVSMPICLVLDHNRRESSPVRALAHWLGQEWSLD